MSEEAAHWYPFDPSARGEIVEKARRAAERSGHPEIVHSHARGKACDHECQTVLPPSDSILTL